MRTGTLRKKARRHADRRRSVGRPATTLGAPDTGTTGRDDRRRAAGWREPSEGTGAFAGDRAAVETFDRRRLGRVARADADRTAADRDRTGELYRRGSLFVAHRPARLVGPTRDGPSGVDSHDLRALRRVHRISTRQQVT